MGIAHPISLKNNNMIDIIKNTFKRKSAKKNCGCDEWTDYQTEMLSDYMQSVEADLRYTIAELTEEIEDLKEEVEALKASKIKAESANASKIFYKPLT